MEIGDLHPRRYFAAIAVVLGLLFALVSNEDGAALWLRVLQWQLQTCLPMALLLISHLALARFPSFERVSPWWRLGCSGMLGAALFAPGAAVIDALLLGEGARALSAAAVGGEFLALAPPVTLTWMAINAPFLMGLRLRRGTDSGHWRQLEPGQMEADQIEGRGGDGADIAPDASPGSLESSAALPFLELVPATARGPVRYLEAELHYLAVVTGHARSLILYNLRDAAAELEAAGVPGIRTHRAFWVALSEVSTFRRSGRQGLLRLQDGTELPVSRRRLGETEAAVEEELTRRGLGVGGARSTEKINGVDHLAGGAQ